MHAMAPKIRQRHQTRRGMHAMRLALSGMKTASAAPIPIKQHPMKYPRTIGYFHSHDLGAAHDNARFQFPARPAAEPASACETGLPECGFGASQGQIPTFADIERHELQQLSGLKLSRMSFNQFSEKKRTTLAQSDAGTLLPSPARQVDPDFP